MSGTAEILNAHLVPSKADIAARFGGIATLEGSYRLIDPAGQVGIEVLIGQDFDGRLVQMPLSYRSEELDPEHTLCTMEHSELGQRYVSNALGDPVAVGEFVRTILEGDDGATRSDGVAAALDLRGSGTLECVPISDVRLREVTRQRVLGSALVTGTPKDFLLRIPRLPRPIKEAALGHTTPKNHLLGWRPGNLKHTFVIATLAWVD